MFIIIIIFMAKFVNLSYSEHGHSCAKTMKALLKYMYTNKRMVTITQDRCSKQTSFSRLHIHPNKLFTLFLEVSMRVK